MAKVSASIADIFSTGCPAHNTPHYDVPVVEKDLKVVAQWFWCGVVGSDESQNIFLSTKNRYVLR